MNGCVTRLTLTRTHGSARGKAAYRESVCYCCTPDNGSVSKNRNEGPCATNHAQLLPPPSLLLLLLPLLPPQNYEDVIHDALRIVAYSMEAHNWDLVRWFLQEHKSPDLGGYFLPIIAQVSFLCSAAVAACRTWGSP